ncbi:hypothetical protein DDE83_000010 [Stemphylium lycopersici]|uniref:Uncharacterized protein n=1 Tax=Stemphylium lycopersici TaxID=183478 RepID=A0A364NGH9_STELY|nr:hypothetical protein DDE83_000010 [Stemphylium lycopersici]
MPFLLFALSFAATATAQVTTSFWGDELGTNKIGFVGSVVNANDTHTTVVVDFDEGTNATALPQLKPIGTPITMTIGPEYFGRTNVLGYNIDPDNEEAQKQNEQKIDCEWPTPEDEKSNRTCIASYGPGFVQGPPCGTFTYYSSSTVIVTYTNPYPARLNYSAGMETIVTTATVPLDYSAVSSVPTSCGDDVGDTSEDGHTTEFIAEPSNFATYQLVITAGEGLLSASPAATPTESDAQSTGGDETSSSDAPEDTGNAATKATGMPIIMGLGAAAAFFL